MIKHEIDNPVDRDNIVGENTFSIKASATAFQILSSGLYSDKILAIVRELSCNAYDSHVLAGKANVPIEIKLPTSLDPTFYVKDFGTGLSDEQIRGKLVDTVNSKGQIIGSTWEGGLYRTYFDSTKTDSNDYIGALGLGSKSPFSYVSTFTVESRYNGTKMIYSCFINEIGVPSIVKLGDQETDEENGLTVSLSAKKDDSGKFYSAARRALMYFTPLPIVIGYQDFKPYTLTHTFTGSNWKIRVNDYSASMRGPHIVQGFVAYPIDGSLLKEHGLSKVAAVFTNMAVDFTVDIGQVEVAASREALSYDQRTIKNLVNVFEIAATELRASLQDGFDKCESLWDAVCLVNEIRDHPSYDFRDLYNKLHSDTPFTWQGQPVTEQISLDMNDIHNTVISKYVGYSSSSRVRKTQKWTRTGSQLGEKMQVRAGKAVCVMVDTVSNGTKTLYEEYVLKLQQTKSSNARILYVISPINRTSYDQTEIDNIITQLGSPVYVKAADVGIVKKKRIVNQIKRDKQERLVWSGFGTRRDCRGYETIHRVFSNRCWNREIVDLSEGGYYVPIDRFTINHNGVDITYFDNILNSAIKLGMLTTIPKVYGFREQQLNKLPKHHTWINILDEIKFKYTQFDHDKSYTNQLIFSQVIYDIGSKVKELFIDCWPSIKDEIEDGKFKSFIQMLYDKSQIKGFDNESLQCLRRSFCINDDVDNQVNKLTKQWDKIYEEEYDILSCVTLQYVTPVERKIIIKYINLIERANVPV